MKVVSGTLIKNNESIILDALNSVKDMVDACLVVDTGSTDSTIEVAKDLLGDKLILEKYRWVNDFADARNFLLSKSSDLGFDWMLNCDSDERIVSSNIDLKEHLNSFKSNLILAPYQTGFYNKERVFRLPNNSKWIGRTHECYIPDHTGTQTSDKIRFWEVGKTGEQYKQKFLRDIDILKKETKDKPKDPRWWYYLGDSYKNVQMYEDAIKAYHKCWLLNGWDEESAFAMFRAAECCCITEQWDRGLEFCGMGIARNPNTPELMWLAGLMSYRAGRYEKAIMYSRYSLAGGRISGFNASFIRRGFRHNPGIFEGPYDVLAWSYLKLGDQAKYDEYQKEKENAENIRKKHEHG